LIEYLDAGGPVVPHRAVSAICGLEEL
jgi:hypothetical protein